MEQKEHADLSQSKGKNQGSDFQGKVFVHESSFGIDLYVIVGKEVGDRVIICYFDLEVAQILGGGSFGKEEFLVLFMHSNKLEFHVLW